MKTNHNYQPEDMEALLAQKSFRELYEEEKKFVLEHLASADEYEHLREMLLALRGNAGASDDDRSLRPSARVKENLMKEFRRERRKTIFIWWNSVGLALRDRLRPDVPVMRIAYVTVVLVVGIFVVMKMNSVVGGRSSVVGGRSSVVSGRSSVVSGRSPVVSQKKKAVNRKIVAGNIYKNKHQSKRKRNDIQTPKVTFTDVDSGKISSAFIWDFGDSAKNKNADGIVQNDSVHKIIPAVANVTGNAICNGASNGFANVTASGGTAPASYSWSPLTTATSAAPPLLSGSYVLTVTNANGASTVNGTTVALPQSRSLSEDAKVIGVFYGLR